MRLLFISNLFPDADQPWRGLDNVTLLHALKAQRPEAEIRVLCLRPSHRYWTGGRCLLKPRPSDEALAPSYHWAPYVPRFGGANDLLFEMAVRRALRSLPQGWRPDALLVPWLFPDAAGVNRCRELAGLPMVAVAQGSDVHRYLEMPMRRRAILRLARRAGIVTRSEDLRRRLIETGSLPAQVRTIYNGVHTEIFQPGEKRMARRSIGLPLEGKIALFVGNFLPVKGLDLLIRACGIAKAKAAERFHLVAIGSGPLEAELRALALECGLEKNFLLMGRRPPEEVAQFMRAADVVCLSSHNEGVPNVVLEALASGRPLISTDVGGIAEVVPDCPGAARLVQSRSPAEYADALVQTLRAMPEAEVLSAHASPYSWGACATAYWRALDTAPNLAIDGVP